MENRKKWIFIAYALLVLLIPAYIIGSSENILANGKLYKFRMQGRDPFDFFRGNYLNIRIETEGIPTDDDDWEPGETVYLSIETDEEGFAYFDEASRTAPRKGDYMVSRINRVSSLSSAMGAGFFGSSGGSKATVDVEMPNNLTKYYINEEYALRGENLTGRRGRSMSTLGVRVKNGSVRIQDIYVGKIPIMKYLESDVVPPVDEDIFLNF